jgi:hypothetical protein
VNSYLKLVMYVGGLGISYVAGVFYGKQINKPKVRPEDEKAINDVMDQINAALAGLKDK